MPCKWYYEGNNKGTCLSVKNRLKHIKEILQMQYPRSTLKKGSKVKSNHTNTFPAHDFLWFTIKPLGPIINEL